MRGEQTFEYPASSGAIARTTPLAGIRVLEFGHVAAGPFAGLLLADLGADVIKVEPVSGDTMRAWPPLVLGTGGRYSGNFASLNRNKRSLTADLRDRDQFLRVRTLADKADVIVENYRPGALGRLGLGYHDLIGSNPGLIYCSISGYGQDGPRSQMAAFDVAIQAMTGMMSVTGDTDGPPVKCGVPVADFVAGLYGVTCILAALHDRARTGQGTYIDCPMVATLLSISALQTSEYFGTGIAPRRLGSAHPRNAPYQAFQAADGLFVMAAGNDTMWQNLCVDLRREELSEDPRFADQESRATNQVDLEEILNEEFSKHPVAYWLDRLPGAGVAVAPILDFEEALGDVQVEHLELVGEIRLPNGTTQPTVCFPAKLSGLRPEVRRQPPALGEHTAEVIDEWLSVDPVGEKRQ